MTIEVHSQQVHDRQGHAHLNQRLEDIGWGLFLVVLGSLWLVPESVMPRVAWVIAAGLIMIGVNAVRYMKGIAINWFSTGLGVLAVSAGAADLSGLNLPFFPMVLVVAGLMLLLKPLFGARPSCC